MSEEQDVEVEVRATVTFPEHCQLTPDEAIKAAASTLQSGPRQDGYEKTFEARLVSKDDQFPEMPNDGRLRVSVSSSYLVNEEDVAGEQDVDKALRKRAIEMHEDCIGVGNWWCQLTIGNTKVATAPLYDDTEFEMEVENDRLFEIQKEAKSGITLHACSEGVPPVAFPAGMFGHAEGGDRDILRRALFNGRYDEEKKITLDKESSAILTKIATTFQDDGYITHLKDVVWKVAAKGEPTKEAIRDLLGEVRKLTAGLRENTASPTI